MGAMAELPLPAGLNAGTFPAKLWRLVNSPRVVSVRWDSRAQGLLIDRSLFERELLSPAPDRAPAPRNFRATRFRSFVRQLYRYGFHKMPGWLGSAVPGDASAWLPCANPCFRRDRPDLLLRIQRRSAANRQRLLAGREGRSHPPRHFSPSVPPGSAGCAASMASSSAQNPSAEDESPAADLGIEIEKMIPEIRRSLPQRSPSAQGHNNVVPESSGDDAVNKAATEDTSSGTESCRNSSPEHEEPGKDFEHLEGSMLSEEQALNSERDTPRTSENTLGPGPAARGTTTEPKKKVLCVLSDHSGGLGRYVLPKPGGAATALT
ncbi:heat shock factor protein 5-like [Cinclus cinclus]|uniref:heat shock factor protein 5-like n=1 Tax=Cinclus cinclus TaxID=127875 RepID=UPI002E121181